MVIKIKATSKPTRKTVKMECPNCKLLLERFVPINAKQGKDECGICGTKFEWKEEDGKIYR